MSDIVITEKEIEGWKVEKVRLEGTIKELQAKLDIVNRRLEALRLFSVNSDELLSNAAKEPAELTGPTVVLSVLERAGKPMKPKEVKEAVLKTDFPKEKWGKSFGYLYAVLSRLVETGKLHKEAGLYQLP